MEEIWHDEGTCGQHGVVSRHRGIKEMINPV